MKKTEKIITSVNLDAEPVEFLKRYCKVSGDSMSGILNSGMLLMIEKIKKEMEHYKEIIEKV